MRPRSMRYRALSMTLVLVSLGTVGACASDPAESSTATPPSASATPTAAALDWKRLPAPPLSARAAAIAVAVDDRLLVVGGDDGTPCPPTADCAATPVARQDGATYDPGTRKWTPIEEAPVGLLNQHPYTVAGDVLFVLTEDDLLSYDPAADRWEEHPLPSAGRRDLRLVAIGDRPAAVAGERTGERTADEIYDPATEEWTALPADPLGPSFDRVYTDTPTGAVLTAKERVAAPGSVEPSIVRAAQLSPDLRSWKQLPDSEMIGGYRWAWTGERLVDPTLGEADGGSTNSWGRSLPYGGTFDPVTGTWARLVGAPNAYSGGWMVEALGGPVSASGGWLYDDRSATWAALTAPADAPQLPGSAAWVGDILFVVGGQFDDRSGEEALSAASWSLTVDLG